MRYTAYIRDEKIWSIDFPYGMYMAYTAYIREEKSWSRLFPFGKYMSCAAYIRDEKVGHDTTACTLPEQSIYAKKIVGPVTSRTAYTWRVQPIYAMKKAWSRDFLYVMYMVCTTYIYIC
jgi:hypothetical protein